MIARIRALLRREGVARSAKLAVAGIEIDQRARSVSREGVPIELTPREFALLEYLMHNVGSTLSKAQILDHVWSPSFVGDENVVEVYIGYLRKKVDAPFGKKSIVTVRGVGYRLEEDE